MMVEERYSVVIFHIDLNLVIILCVKNQTVLEFCKI